MTVSDIGRLHMLLENNNKTMTEGELIEFLKFKSPRGLNKFLSQMKELKLLTQEGNTIHVKEEDIIPTYHKEVPIK